MDITERRNQDYDLEGKAGGLPEPTVDLSALYDGSAAHAYSGASYHTKPTMTFSFDNQGATRPQMYQRDLPQLRDIRHLQRAAQQEYDRMFD
jgi:hypothetical protein